MAKEFGSDESITYEEVPTEIQVKHTLISGHSDETGKKTKLEAMVTKPPTIGDVKKIIRGRHTSAYMSSQISKGGKWPVARSGSASYFRTFQDLFREVPIETDYSDILKGAPNHHLTRDSDVINNDIIREIAERKRERNGNVSVLDAMGYGAILFDLDADGVSIGMEQNNSSRYIRGDLLSPRTWQALDAAPIKTFDMIFCRPFGPIDVLPSEAYKALLERAYEKLSPDDGLLLTEVGRGSGKKLVEVVEALNEIPGVFAKVDTEHNVFMLIKQKTAPEKLY